MTANERLEKLLNRAGQTISHLPKRYGQEHRSTAFDAADKFGGSLSMTQNFEDYILHLTDVIDRMETALENVIGERDYLADVVERGGLFSCEMCALEEGSEDCCVDADFNETGKQPIFRVPEDWRADDETD